MLCGDSVKLSQCSVVRNIVDFKDILWRQIFVLGVDVRVFLPGYFQQFGVGGCSSQFEYKTQVSYGRYFQKVFSVRHFSHRKRLWGLGKSLWFLYAGSLSTGGSKQTLGLIYVHSPQSAVKLGL